MDISWYNIHIMAYAYPEEIGLNPSEVVHILDQQRESSLRARKARFEEIKENENQYFMRFAPIAGLNFQVPIPMSSGFVDTLLSKVDDPPVISYTQQGEENYKPAIKISAAWRSESSSPLPNHKWAYKDRAAKKLAIFSGRAIFVYFAEADPDYRSNLEVVDHYDFHCEPDGGGHLENHLFLGRDRVYKTDEQIRQGVKEGVYLSNALTILNNSRSDYRGDYVDYLDHYNRARAMGYDAENNTFVGQKIYALTEWCFTYGSKRYYALWDPQSRALVRLCLLTDLFPDNMYPFVSWATHEDWTVFWSKAPMDDIRPITDAAYMLLNQELHNRQKRNNGKMIYDEDMFDDVAALDSDRPDALVPAKAKKGVSIQRGLIQVETPELNGTINLVEWLDSFVGTKTGITAATQGTAEKDKRVGVFFGELQQVSDRLGLVNKSYREAWAELGLRYKSGLVHNLNREIAVELIGIKGIEHDVLTQADIKDADSLDIIITGGTEKAEEAAFKSERRTNAIAQAINSGIPLNKVWLGEQILANGEYDEQDIARALDVSNNTNPELMSEAAQAIEDIVEGKDPALNYGADTAFIQKILDFAVDHTAVRMGSNGELVFEEGDINGDTYKKLVRYAMLHATIAQENMKRRATLMGIAPTTDSSVSPTDMLATAGSQAPSAINSQSDVASVSAQMSNNSRPGV